MSEGPLQHGKTYTVITYCFRDTRLDAPNHWAVESFRFEEGKGSFADGAWRGSLDTIVMGHSTAHVPPGWETRTMTTGVYNAETKRFEPVRPAIVMVPLPAPEGEK